jgi:hypothetical protein
LGRVERRQGLEPRAVEGRAQLEFGGSRFVALGRHQRAELQVRLGHQALDRALAAARRARDHRAQHRAAVDVDHQVGHRTEGLFLRTPLGTGGVARQQVESDQLAAARELDLAGDLLGSARGLADPRRRTCRGVALLRGTRLLGEPGRSVGRRTAGAEQREEREDRGTLGDRSLIHGWTLGVEGRATHRCIAGAP